MIKVADITFGRLQSPDLDVAEEFLTDFGMVKVDRTNDRLFMRGTGTDPVIHITHRGPQVHWSWISHKQHGRLEKATKLDGASGIEDFDAPGGGKVVRLTDPHGYSVEIVGGQEQAEEIIVPRFKVNDVDNKDVRAGELTRSSAGAVPCQKGRSCRYHDHRYPGRHQMVSILWVSFHRTKSTSKMMRIRLSRHSTVSTPVTNMSTTIRSCVCRVRKSGLTIFRSRCTISTTLRWAMRICSPRKNTIICGAWAATCSAARFLIIGAIRGAGCTSTGPTATG